MGYGAFASVLTGWTGTITLNSRVITPRSSESVASLVARLREYCAFDGLTLSVSVASSGVITLTGSAAFTLTLTGTCETRTGFTAGPYGSATSQTAAGAYTGAWVPTRGIRLDAPRVDTSDGAATSSGVYATSGHRDAGSGAATVWTSYADAAVREDASDTADYWEDGRLVARSFAAGWRRSRMGLLPTHVQLAAEMVGVTD